MLAALFKEQKAGKNPSIHQWGNELIGFAHLPNRLIQLLI